MGYESTLVAVTGPPLNEDGTPMDKSATPFCGFVAAFDLSKVGYTGPLSKLISESIQAEKERIAAEGWSYSYYPPGADKIVHDDRYDDPVSPIPLDKLIEAMTEEMEGDPNPYRRFTFTLAALKAFAADVEKGRWGNYLTILHYGY